MPDDSDSPDPNRVFPGPLTWTTDQLVGTIVRELLEPADALIDFHVGGWGHADLDIITGDDYRGDVAEAAERMALAFGTPTVRRSQVVGGFPGPKSSIGYAGGQLGIPAIAVEVGGAGFAQSLERSWIDATSNGIQAVMGHLGMLQGAPDPRPSRQLVYERSFRVNPTNGGLLRSRFGGRQLGDEIKAGTLLGEVVSPYTGETLEELRAPVDGLLFMASRDYPVVPGGWAYGLAATTTGKTRWVENRQRQEGSPG